MKNGNNNCNGLKVSIITVVLNGAKTIEKAMQSVFDQSYDNVEYIIVDGMSTDGTDEIIKEYFDRISKYIREKDSGIYDAMNKGIRIATGDIIGILNADDWYEREAIGEAVSIFENSPDIQVAAGRIVEYDNLCGKRISNIYSMNVIWKHMPFPHPASFVRKEVYDQLGYYDLSYKICADYDFVFRLFVEDVRVGICDAIWSNFRQGGASTSDFIRTAKESNQIRTKYGCLYPDLIDGDELRRICDRELKYACLLECYYRKTDLLLNILKEMYPNGIRIYGFGIWGKLITDFCLSHGIDVFAIYDRNENMWDREYEGIRIVSPERIAIDAVERVFVAILYDGVRIAEDLSIKYKINFDSVDLLSEKLSRYCI